MKRISGPVSQIDGIWGAAREAPKNPQVFKYITATKPKPIFLAVTITDVVWIEKFRINMMKQRLL